MSDAKAPAVEVKLGFQWQGLLISILVGLGIYLVPVPEGLTPRAWGMFALFVATIVAIIAKAMPMGAATCSSFSLQWQSFLAACGYKAPSIAVQALLARTHGSPLYSLFRLL